MMINTNGNDVETQMTGVHLAAYFGLGGWVSMSALLYEKGCMS
jgi:hypothetical protein